MRLRSLPLFLVFAGMSAAQNNGVAPAAPALPPLTLSARAKMYTAATVGPGSLAAGLLATGFNQWRDVPPEWGQGAAGFGRRYGYYMAGSAASNAIEFTVSALRHEDTRYVRSGKGGFWRRAGYIIVHTYRVPNDRGKMTFATSRIVGSYGSAFVANAWNPSRLNGPGEAMLRGTWSLAGDMGNSAFLEFWPDIRRKLFHKR